MVRQKNAQCYGECGDKVGDTPVQLRSRRRRTLVAVRTALLSQLTRKGTARELYTDSGAQEPENVWLLVKAWLHAWA
jgi:hypothetical protein